ncbi:hypothetical protein KBAD11_27390 [Aeromonas dhakensis]|nr:hypothetical protein KBAD45_26750 [Aeromonas dhakensis]CAD7513708.1 hypothetical protein KBAD50_15770 [Aeromonas dhakensis]CAD7514050.1 hypothetical protein KBAD49_15770 [Aeromonas dhakensis]CAD7516416.1 hypothetical protein KBAD59_27430 [Aeromonas dhakensis]CAD7517270.1 hypothetical protein KBAD11_27390 [Aeromonas dhakensis]
MIKKLILSTLLLCGLANAAPSSTLDAVLERGVLRVGFDAGDDQQAGPVHRL